MGGRSRDRSLISRRAFAAGALANTLVQRAFARELRVPPIAGAIRWDAWYSRKDSSVAAQNNLYSPEFRARAPAHCEIKSSELDCEGDQAVLDAEIRAARRAGLSYWAFDWFSETASFRVAWKLYQSSNVRSELNWCGIVSLDQLGSDPFQSEKWRQTVDYWAELMGQPEYQKVEKNRPILYIFYRPEEARTYLAGQPSNLKTSLAYLSSQLEKRGLGSPYVILFNPSVDADLLRATGVEATSNYIGGFQRKKFGTFKELSAQVERYWQRMAKTGSNVVPIAQIGWDTRPRIVNPVPWERAEKPNRDTSMYYAIATPDEFAQHIRNAVTFMERNSQYCPYRLLLIYSWNECDEGGCMLPTLGDPSGKYVTALSSALQGEGR